MLGNGILLRIITDCEMANPAIFEDYVAAEENRTTMLISRERQKKSTMACEMCRKRKVRFNQSSKRDKADIRSNVFSKPAINNY